MHAHLLRASDDVTSGFSQIRLAQTCLKRNSLFPIYFLELRFPGKTMTSLPVSQKSHNPSRYSRNPQPTGHLFPIPRTTADHQFSKTGYTPFEKPTAHARTSTNLRPTRLLESSQGLSKVFPKSSHRQTV